MFSEYEVIILSQIDITNQTGIMKISLLRKYMLCQCVPCVHWSLSQFQWQEPYANISWKLHPNI